MIKCPHCNEPLTIQVISIKDVFPFQICKECHRLLGDFVTSKPWEERRKIPSERLVNVLVNLNELFIIVEVIPKRFELEKRIKGRAEGYGKTHITYHVISEKQKLLSDFVRDET